MDRRLKTFLLIGLVIGGLIGFRQPAAAQVDPNSGCCQPSTGGSCIENLTVGTCPAPNTFYLGQTCAQVPACSSPAPVATTGCCQPSSGAACIEDETAGTCPAPNTLHLGQTCVQVPACANPVPVPASGCCEPSLGSQACINNTTVGTCPSPNTLHLGKTCGQVASCANRGAGATTPTSGSTPIPELTLTPEVSFPGFSGVQTVNDNLIGRYIRTIYVYFVWVVGVLATVMVIYGGVKWVAAAGNPGRINDARETINNAIIGVIIALTSIVLLNLISPGFTTLGLPKIGSVKADPYSGQIAKTVCPEELNITCGAMHKIGSIRYDAATGRELPVMSTQGTVQDLNCIGTTCLRGGLAGAGEVTRVCSIEADAKTGFLTSQAGCLRTFDYDPAGAPGGLANYSSIEVDQAYAGVGVQVRSKCGDLIEFFGHYTAGGWCTGAGVSVMSGANPQCYLLGPTGKILDKPSPQTDVVTNLCCPGAACPSTNK